MSDVLLPGDAVDLTNCDREPIHILGHVQPFGALIAASPDWIVMHASANVADILGLQVDDLVGTRLVDHFPAETLHTLRTKIQILDRDGSGARIFGFDLFNDGRRFDVSAHMSGRSFIFEFEPKSGTGDRDEMNLVQPLIARVRTKDSVVAACREAARMLKALSGFDRVMVYRFEEDDSGTVVAEAREPDLEPFLDLHYPASDIPKQARELYKRSLLRLIADVGDTPSPILPKVSAEGQPLDLSLAVTRAVSPIHIEYLRNMDVKASMSVSIVSRGRLWGLFACHHYSPRYIDFEKRSAVELFGQLFAYELTQKETDAERAQAERARVLHDRLMSRMTSNADLSQGFAGLAGEIGEVIAFDGIALYADGHYTTLGVTPSEEEFRGLSRFLNTAATSTVFATDHLSGRYPRAAEFEDRVAGILALPVSRTPRDYIVLFRREVARTVTWAGNPEKAVEFGPNGIRLTPRRSFEAWKEEVKGHSIPWTAGERQAAEALRITLLEVVLRVTDEANLLRRRANEQQELLIAELNHRVRNILNLIRGLVHQTRGDAGSIESYTKVLDGRITALARAHDQLTDRDWGAAPLSRLIRTEVGAFMSRAGEQRVRIVGPEVLLEPEAYTTLALVFHELVTNSAKYGALSDSSGHIDLKVQMEDDGRLKIDWCERGGPAVQAPRRRGFGTTVVEHSIPYELRGEAQLRFRVTGVEASFAIPARYVKPGSDDASVADSLKRDQPPPPPPMVKGPVLLVEDNMIIAMDAQDILATLGITDVYTANSSGAAMRRIQTEGIVLGILDVNLGSETSTEIARELAERGIPFVFATGYGAASDLVEAHPGVPVVRKPYEPSDLSRAISTVLVSGEA